MRIQIFALLPCLAAVSLAAPQGGAPAAQVAAFDRLVGQWTGSGTVTMVPGAEPLPWTSDASIRKVLEGHFLLEELQVDIGEGMPPLEMRILYGWDASNERYVQYAASNMGAGTVSEILWPDADTMVAMSTGAEMGMIVTQRSVTNLKDGEFTMRIDRAVGAGEFFPHVEGTYRLQESVEAAASRGAQAPAAPSGDLSDLKPMVGTWDVSGSMVPAPGAEKMTFTGTETVEPAVGGNALFHHVVGEGGGMQYEAYGLTWRDPRKDCFVFAWADNMGDCTAEQGYLAGPGTLVTTSSGSYRGLPYAHRGILELGEGTMKVTADRYTGTEPGLRMFEATYVRKQ